MFRVFNWDNIENVTNLKPIICFYSSKGACGPSGTLVVVFENGDSYGYGTTFDSSDVELTKAIVNHVPEFKGLMGFPPDFHPKRENFRDELESIYLGMGNYCFVRSDINDDIIRLSEENNWFLFKTFAFCLEKFAHKTLGSMYDEIADELTKRTLTELFEKECEELTDPSAFKGERSAENHFKALLSFLLKCDIHIKGKGKEVLLTPLFIEGYIGDKWKEEKNGGFYKDHCHLDEKQQNNFMKLCFFERRPCVHLLISKSNLFASILLKCVEINGKRYSEQGVFEELGIFKGFDSKDYEIDLIERDTEGISCAFRERILSEKDDCTLAAYREDLLKGDEKLSRTAYQNLCQNK